MSKNKEKFATIGLLLGLIGFTILIVNLYASSNPTTGMSGSTISTGYYSVFSFLGLAFSVLGAGSRMRIITISGIVISLIGVLATPLVLLVL